MLVPGEFQTKCVTCDEFLYCRKCVVKCPCGQGETHYLCKNKYVDHHLCEWSSADDQQHCNARVCKQYCGIKDLNGEVRLYCPNHHPRISKRLRDEVIHHIIHNEDKRFKDELKEKL